ncbi:MAG: pilus assembly protein [Planctomycetota bacterium]|nr:pilus assembly protein [Planctomycetota bacterium]
MNRSRNLSARSGVSTLEAIVALPIVIIVTFAIFQFGILMVVQQTVTRATIEAARAASQESTATAANIAAIAAANDVLAVHNLTIDSSSTDTTSDTKLVLEYGTASAIQTGDPGLTCTPPSVPTMLTSEIRVTICLDLEKSPLKNSLASFGFSLAGKRLEISSHTSIE